MWRLRLKQLFRPLVMRLWIKEVRGLENVPSCGAIVVINHQNAFDPILLYAVLPRLVCFMRVGRDFKKPLLLKWLFTSTSVENISRLLKENKFCCIFKSPSVSHQQIARIALAAKAPLLPIAIMGAEDVWTEENFFPSFNKGVSIAIGAPISFEKFYGLDEFDGALESVGDMIVNATGKVCEEYYSADGTLEKSFFNPNRNIYPL